MLNQLLISADTTTVAAQSTATAYTGNATKHTFHCYWTPGVSGNVLTVKVYTRPKKSGTAASWVQEQEWTGSSGTYTKTLVQYQETASGTTEVPLEIEIEKCANEVKLTYAESSDGGAGKGTFTAYITASN